jgi:hypothetical protein
LAYNVGVYKNGTLYGTGACTNGQFTVATFSASTGRTLANGQNLQITATSGSCVGQTENARLVTGAGGATLTFDKPNSFV